MDHYFSYAEFNDSAPKKYIYLVDNDVILDFIDNVTENKFVLDNDSESIIDSQHCTNSHKLIDQLNSQNCCTDNHFNEMQLELKIISNQISFFHFEASIIQQRIIDDINDNNDLLFGIVLDFVRESQIDPSIETIQDKNTIDLHGFNKNIFIETKNKDILNSSIYTDQTKIMIVKGNLCIDTRDNNLVMPGNFYNLYCQLNNGTIHFIFLDTNLFHYAELTDRYKYLEAVEKLDNMLAWLKFVLNNNKGNIIFIVGYDNIFNSNTIDFFPKINKLLDIFSQFMKNTGYDKKIYYLCSDKNFQLCEQNIISMEINSHSIIKYFQYTQFVGKSKYQGLIIDQIALGCSPINPNIIENNHNTFGTIEIIDEELYPGYMQYTVNPTMDIEISYRIFE